MLGFIIAVIAGYLTPAAEDTLAKPVEAALRNYITVEPGERRLLSFILVMMIAGVAATLLDSSNAFWIMTGGAIGYFGTRLVAAARQMRDDRK